MVGRAATLPVRLKGIASCIRQVPPEGLHDLWGLYRRPDDLDHAVRSLADPFRGGVSAVLGPEARGFILGALVAREVGVGFVPARKQGRYLPGVGLSETCLPDWEGKQSTFTIQAHALRPGQRILVVDDWITTGNQAQAIRKLIERRDAVFAGLAAIVEEGDNRLGAALSPFHALMRWNTSAQHFEPSP